MMKESFNFIEQNNKEELSLLMEEENIYQVLFNSAAEGLVVVDKDGVIKLINPRVEEMFGYKKSELIGQKVETLMPNSFRGKHVEHRSQYTHDPRKRTMGAGLELWAQKKNGNTFPVEISLNYIRTKEGLLVVSLITDITERKKAADTLQELNNKLEERVKQRTEELEKLTVDLQLQIQERKMVEAKLRDSQKIYTTIARNFPKGTISVFDSELKYVFVDGMELHRAGVNSEMLIGTRLIDRLPTEVAQHTEENLREVLKGKSKTFETELRGNHYVLNAVPLPDADGNIKQILVVERNITPQKKAEEEMKKALKKEKELNELKSRFVSMASHEFRTPLSTILSSTSLLERYADPSQQDKREKHINRIKSSVHNLTGILNDFLSLDKLETGKVESTPTQFDITRFAEDVTEEMQTVVKPGQVINYKHLGEDKNVNLDKQMLRNIVINLLSNASKYSDNDQEIEFTTELNSKLNIYIKDQGIGIPEEDKAHMFSRFFRAKNVTNIQGTGLGLNIVKKYVDLMDGSIDFESEQNKGTTFMVKFPFNK